MMLEDQDCLKLFPIRSARGTVRLPGSKSISNRALLLAALSEGTCRLQGVLRADDTGRMLDALRTLGVEVLEDPGDPTSFAVTGCGGRFPVRNADIFLGNAGTAARPLTAALALQGGSYRLDGVARMRERPLGDLLAALRMLGCTIRCTGREGYFPIEVGERVRGGGPEECSVSGSVSSQFLTSLLMSAPVYSGEGGMRIRVEGELISRPYVAMTLKLMERFGVRVVEKDGAFSVPHGSYRLSSPFSVEGDASGASYFLALGALAGGPVRVTGAGLDSIQGDTAFARVIERMGARVKWGSDWIEASAPESGRLRGIEADCTAIPDAAMTLAAMALGAEGETVLTGIGSWRVKETDRIAAMEAELAKFGARVASGRDYLRIIPPVTLQPARVRTYNDHRMAMSLSLAACCGVEVEVLDPGCVSKTFPDYFERLSGLVELDMPPEGR
ncbi:MAG: 3-phosphoshikimate 1-carboxyvinyltransferase [Sutterellaceae bacterium]|nr:3-phosphoshikimate 1-carboxyvinyltransferase [Sutterellaceae bacterium]MDD7441326.1 3-phosphoshikimate 1-carboxyvinyltransferase [Sutterellaceae bacterium]MDY2868071.1 3-phosphoshikimate 1-carboxyvinyltransferase [Mesosutterella sp.]